MAEEKDINEAAQPIIDKILRLMKKRKIRIIDFFTYIGEDPADPVPVKQLVLSIRSVLGSQSAVLIRSPPRSLHALPMPPDSVSISSVGSVQSQSSQSRTNSKVSSSLLSKITRDMQVSSSSAVGLGPKKTGAEAVMRDIIPEDLALILQKQYVKAQKNLYCNGKFYTNKQGKATLEKLSMASPAHFESLQKPPNRKGGIFLQMNPRGNHASGKSSSMSNTMTTTGSGGGNNSPLGSPSPPTPPLPEKLIKPPMWTSLTLSPNFTELAEIRTMNLIQSHSTYDQKRTHHRRELASFY